MAKLAVFPLRVFTTSGTLASGVNFTLTGYEAGTSTPKDFYTDATGTTAYANPYTLPASGTVAVWLGEGAYKFDLKDSLGVSQPGYPIDNVTGLSDNVQVSSKAELTALEAGGNGDLVYMSGYYTAGDGGGGWFYWDENNTTAENAGTIIYPNNPSGTKAWVRIFQDNEVWVEWFGAKADYVKSAGGGGGTATTDSTTAINNAISFVNTAGGGVVNFREGNYQITSPIVIPGTALNRAKVKLKGQGRDATIISKTTNTAGTGSNLFRSGGVTDTYVVDAIMILEHPDNGYIEYTQIHDLTLTGWDAPSASASASTVAYGIYCPRSSFIDIRNVFVESVKTVWHTYDSWAGNLTNVKGKYIWKMVHHEYDSNGGTGTTMRFDSCHASVGVSTESDISLTPIFDLQYHYNASFNNCSIDTFSNQDYRGFQVLSCRGTSINNLDVEALTGDVFSFNSSSGITVDQPQVSGLIGGTTGTHAVISIGGCSGVVFNGGLWDTISPANDAQNYRVTSSSKVTFNQLTPDSFGGSAGTIDSTSTAIVIDANGVTTWSFPDSALRKGLRIDGKDITYGQSPPSAGTWSTSDVFLNGTMTPGEPFGWYCIEAGTPGQWAPISMAANSETFTTTPQDIEISETGQVYDNFGASGTIVANLPPAVVGSSTTPFLAYGFSMQNANLIRLEPDGTEAIRGGGAGEYLQMNTLGGYIKLVCNVAGTWDIETAYGDYEFETTIRTSSQAGFRLKSVTAGITATNPGVQGDSPLVSEINEVATVANASDAVTMPSAVSGMEVVVINNGANTLEIWPASGDNIGAGVDTAVTLASGSNARYVAYDATNWESV